MMSHILEPCEWRAAAESHRQRALLRTAPARARHARGTPHPVEDFLFTYYPYSFGKLETWHPGIGSGLVPDPPMPPHFKNKPYRHHSGICFADPGLLNDKELARLLWLRELLHQTRTRPPLFSCHGLHEWAMVYRGSDVRHRNSTPLRLPQSEIDHLVEDRPIRCSHFDAFRFFHPDTRSLNQLQPTLVSRGDFEQPGCIHANMDLYKWASKAMPWIGSGLLLDCFELALELRLLDMRASPYDLGEFGLEALPIETAEGRREYEHLQKHLAGRASPLRAALIERIDLTLAAAGAPAGPHPPASGIGSRRLTHDQPSPPAR